MKRLIHKMVTINKYNYPCSLMSPWYSIVSLLFYLGLPIKNLPNLPRRTWIFNSTVYTVRVMYIGVNAEIVPFGSF